MWEIVARDQPYRDKEYKWTNEVRDAVLAGVRPSNQIGMTGSYGELMKECWARDPSLRPAFTEIVQRIGRISHVDDREGEPQFAENAL